LFLDVNTKTFYKKLVGIIPTKKTNQPLLHHMMKENS